MSDSGDKRIDFLRGVGPPFSFLVPITPTPGAVGFFLVGANAPAIIFSGLSIMLTVLFTIRVLFPNAWRALDLRLGRSIVRDVDGQKLMEQLAWPEASSPWQIKTLSSPERLREPAPVQPRLFEPSSESITRDRRVPVRTSE